MQKAKALVDANARESHFENVTLRKRLATLVCSRKNVQVRLFTGSSDYLNNLRISRCFNISNNMERQCACGGSHDERELGVQYNLYEKIDLLNVECLNELVEGSGAKIFKPWEERLDHAKFVESDVDEELLFNIPFTGDIKLKGIIIVGGPDESHPSEVKLFKNREGMTFDEAASEPEQKFDLVVDQYGVHEYPIKVAKFSSTHYLTLHFTGNRGAERTRIDYIGLKGEWSPGHRHGVTICSYESMPQHSDHVGSENTFDDFSREVS